MSQMLRAIAETGHVCEDTVDTTHFSKREEYTKAENARPKLTRDVDATGKM